MTKPYIINCELSLEEVTLLRDLLYRNEDITCQTKGSDSKELDLAISLSYAIANGCKINYDYYAQNHG